MKKLKFCLAFYLITASISNVALMGWFDSSDECCNPCQRPWYVSATGSVGFRSSSNFVDPKMLFQPPSKFHFKTVCGGALAAGFKYDQFRLELEGSYRQCFLKNYQTSSNVTFFSKSAKVGNLSFLTNGYIDICLNECLRFYVGAGLGFSYVYGPTFKTSSNTPMITQNNNSKYRHQDTVFAWQLLTGFIIPINDCFDVVFGYRYFATAKSKTAKVDGSAIKLSNSTHLVEAGIRFKF